MVNKKVVHLYYKNKITMQQTEIYIALIKAGYTKSDLDSLNNTNPKHLTLIDIYVLHNMLNTEVNIITRYDNCCKEKTIVPRKLTFNYLNAAFTTDTVFISPITKQVINNYYTTNVLDFNRFGWSYTKEGFITHTKSLKTI